MYIKSINLKNYRNIKGLFTELSPTVNIIKGENAQGKTNILESIYMCSTGRSHKSGTNDRDIIAFNQKEARIGVNVISSGSDKIEFYINSALKKFFSVNGVPIKKMGDLFGVLNSVFFGSQDLKLIQSGPAERRRFLDMELCQISNIYYVNLKGYYRVLKHRNNFLKMLREDRTDIDLLEVYDIQLTEYGNKLIEIRRDFINRLNKYAESVHSDITSGRERLKIVYKPDASEKLFIRRLVLNHESDIMNGCTSHGIHKDEIVFFINDVNVKEFGSQGQQRSACLSTKLGEIELFKEESGESPVLLLDDVFSELDKSRQQCLFNAIGNTQTIITCTGIEDSIKPLADKANIINIKNGNIEKD